jgi:molecular chaperone DnaK
MAQVKMKYGIDLGTTNSAICKMENGEPTIKKTDTLKDTLPSCVSFTKKKVIKVGDAAYNDLKQDKARTTKKWGIANENVFLEFKRTMGLDTQYMSNNMGRSFSSEELSSEVLKTLKSFVSDDTINAAVITIPAKFKADQIAATKRAATLAGIEHCELLQEPIAASMAYGLNSTKKDGIWLVFDFGGGTFDAALLKVEDGVLQVKDTEGDNYLGGKNLDYAIVDDIIIPYLQENFTIDNILADDDKKQILRDAMKYYAEQAKNQLSFKEKCDITSMLDEFGEDDEGNEIELDMVITQEQLKKVVAPTFQKAIDICKSLLVRNNLKGSDLDSLILVGGPTYSPVLRGMLKAQITPNVDTSIDPMTAVARGAALYASGVETVAKEEIKANTIALDLNYESSSVETMEFVSIKLLPSECTGKVPSTLYVELTRNDKGWSSGKIEINEIGDVIECQLIEGKANSFTIVAYDEKGSMIPCFPNEVNIMQGLVVGNAVLPYNIGIEVHDNDSEKDVFEPLKGLEKNQQIPAVGVANGLKVPLQLRPGMSSDKLIIPIYQGEYNVEGTSAIYNDHVFDVVITGDDAPALIPESSDIDITVKVDRSQMMKLEATFPVIGETVEKDIDVKQRLGVNESDLQKRLDEAKQKLNVLQSAQSVTKEETAQPETMLSDISNRFDGEKNTEDGKMHLLADLPTRLP